jgi:hypothetical protein
MTYIATVGADRYEGNTHRLANLTMERDRSNSSDRQAIRTSNYLTQCVGLDDGFREGICARDGRCVISGVVNTMAPYEWFGFDAAHIYPVAKDTLGIRGNYRINSAQSGFLLQSTVHQLFSQYRISVNPDVSWY